MSENNNNEEYGESYNQYVLSDGIWVKIDAESNARILDYLHVKARKKIRERGGMLTTPDALELVLTEDRQEIINDIVQGLRKERLPLIADAFRNEETRDDAMRLLRMELENMEKG